MRLERAGLSRHYSQGAHRSEHRHPIGVVLGELGWRAGWDGSRLLQVEAADKAVCGGRREMLGSHKEF